MRISHSLLAAVVLLFASTVRAQEANAFPPSDEDPGARLSADVTQPPPDAETQIAPSVATSVADEADEGEGREEVVDPVEDLQNQVFDLEERLDRVERESQLDRVQLSGDYRTILNAVRYRGPTPDPYDRDPMNPLVGRRIDQTNAEIWSHRLRLRLLAQPTEHVRITARLTMYKIFGDGDAAPFVQDSMTSRLPRDSALHVDQAWLDWFVTDWLSLSGGRVAYAGGNPGELRENGDQRQATWGLQMVDGEYDTVNATLDLSSWVPGWYVRGFYASWFNDSDSDPFGGFPFLTSGTSSLRIYGGNIDFQIPGVGRNFVQVGYYDVPSFRPFNVPIPDPAYDPSADYTHAPAPLAGNLLFPSNLPSSLGSYQNLSGLIEFYDIGGSGLDLFAAGALGLISPNDQAISYDLPNPMDPSAGRVPVPFLRLASAGDSGKTYFAYAGARYTVPIDALNRPRIGVEFNYGSRYLMSFATQTDQLLTKLATRGKAYEAYMIVPVGDHLFVRLDYLRINGTHQGGFFGANPDLFGPGATSPRVDTTIDSFQLIVNASM